MNKISKCPKCGYENWSQLDKKYAELYGCWHCDKERWEKKELTTREFEERERIALDAIEDEK